MRRRRASRSRVEGGQQAHRHRFRPARSPTWTVTAACATSFAAAAAAALTADAPWIHGDTSVRFTQATEKHAQTPNPPPETFHPIKTRKGAGKSAVDPASLAAAAASAAETLATGSLQEVSDVHRVFFAGIFFFVWRRFGRF